MAEHTILFLAANPADTERLAIDREARAIHEALERSGQRDRFELVTRWAVEPLDLLRELRKLRPTIVHFSGHGGRNVRGSTRGGRATRDIVPAGASDADAPRSGLFFAERDGRAQVVDGDAIRATFGAAGTSVRLVVLNACYSAAQADALVEHVDCVIGMSGSIQDDAARSFAIGFYGALGENTSIAAAYRDGRAAIQLESLPNADHPQLKERLGFDAEQCVLAAVAPSLRVELECPYRGMRPYAKEDSPRFHGRDAEINDLINRLRAGEREIFVIGPSGSGKSSLVAAGVVPRLERGIAGLGPFLVRTMRPGENPATRLRELLGAALLADRFADSLLLIVVDQLEELFTLAGAAERSEFLAALGALRARPACAIVLTLRADFFGALMESPLWAERKGRLSRIEVAPLRGDDLRDAIAQPARGVGVEVDPALLERLLADAASEPGILPLLQETMVQLWDIRAEQRLTLADYEALGDGHRSGLAVALSRRADATLRVLEPSQEQIVRRIMLRLVHFGEGRADTRRQQPRSALRGAAADPAELDRVLGRLIADRLLTADDDEETSDGRVDLAHEVMITAWPLLAEWIQAYRGDEHRRRQLETAAGEWVKHGRGARGLLDPIELADAEAWQRTESARELGQSANVAALIAASSARHERIRWLTRGVGAGVFLLLTVIATTAISVARAQEQELQRDALRFNAYAAHALAGAVAFHLRQQIDTVVAIASEPAAARWLHDADHEALQRRRRETPFESFTLLDRAGKVISNAGAYGFRNLGKEYAWRDYFLGARRLGEAGLRAGYISRVIRSEDDNLHKFGIAAPIYDEGRWAGVLMATVGTDFALRRKHLDHASEAGPMAVVVAPRDRSRHTTEGEGEYVVILHERLAHGAGVPISSPRLNELRVPRQDSEQLRWIDPEPITDDAHRDPVPGYEGRWLAGFAPVGDTGFVVIVQTRYDAAVAPNARLSRRLALWTGIVLFAWIVLCAAGVWLYWRGGRPHSGDATAAPRTRP
jgi:hypothetical protein